MQKGSITVFFSLVLVLVLSLILTMVESARIQGLETKAIMSADLSEDSLLAEYSTPLWEEYDVLFRNGAGNTGAFDISTLEQEILEVNEYNLGQKGITGLFSEEGVDFYKLTVEEAKVTEYELATDQEGDVFRKAAVEAMKDQIPVDVIKGICEAAGQVDKMDTDVEGKMEAGKNALSSGKKPIPELPGASVDKKKQNATPRALPTEEPRPETPKELPTEEPEPDNPLGTVQKVDPGMLLFSVVDEPSKLSQTVIDLENSLLSREKNQGNLQETYQKSGLMDQVLFDFYLKKHFSCYTDRINEHAIAYELEYLIGGKDSDQENLKAVVRRLLLIREGFNFAQLLKDTEKRGVALTMATLLVGYFGIPQLIQVVEMGILAVWAYGESLDDVRKLLKGESVPLFEVASSGSGVSGSGVSGSGVSGSGVSGSGMADKGKGDLDLDDVKKENNTTYTWNALRYEDYLQILLFLTGDKKLNYRAMDLIEKSIQVQEGYENFSMDCMVQQFRGTIQYKAPVIFDVFSYSGKESWNLEEKINGSY